MPSDLTAPPPGDGDPRRRSLRRRHPATLRRHPVLLACAGAAALVVGISACSASGTDAGSSSTTSTRSKTLIIAENEPPASFDPLQADNSTVDEVDLPAYDDRSVGGVGVQDWQDVQGELGNSSLDVRHQVTGTYVYELPFGQDKFWLTTGIASHIFEGLSVSGSYTFASGAPLSPSYSAEVISVAASSVRKNMNRRSETRR